MTTKILDLNNIERKLFWILISFIALCVSLYVFSVFSFTMSGAQITREENTARELTASGGELEAEYLALQNSITLSYAQSLGLEEVKVKFANVPIAPKLSMAR